MRRSFCKIALFIAFGFTPAMAHAADGDRLNFIMYGETIKLSKQTRKDDAGKTADAGVRRLKVKQVACQKRDQP